MSERDEFMRAQERMKGTVEKVVHELDIGYIRKLQREMHLCCAKCYDDRNATRKELDECEERCKISYHAAGAKVESEFSAWQEQLNRCMTTCQDKQIQQYGTDFSKMSDTQRNQFSEAVAKCAANCMDEHAQVLPKLRDRIVAFLKKNS